MWSILILRYFLCKKYLSFLIKKRSIFKGLFQKSLARCWQGHVFSQVFCRCFLLFLFVCKAGTMIQTGDECWTVPKHRFGDRFIFESWSVFWFFKIPVYPHLIFCLCIFVVAKMAAKCFSAIEDRALGMRKDRAWKSSLWHRLVLISLKRNCAGASR